MANELDDFDLVPFFHGGKARDVLVMKSEGRPLLLLHELFGLTREVVEFARLLSRNGYRPILPILFGETRINEAGDSVLERLPQTLAALCVTNTMWAYKIKSDGVWTLWLEALIDRSCHDMGVEQCSIIGMCLTGNFAIAMASHPRISAAVTAEPSLPLLGKADIHLSQERLEAVKLALKSKGLNIKGYRFSKDRLCAQARFDTLEREFGKNFDGEVIPSIKDRDHSVFTHDLRDESGNFRHGAVASLLTYLGNRP